MDGMKGGFNDRAEIAANLLYPSSIDGNCTKQEIFWRAPLGHFSNSGMCWRSVPTLATMRQCPNTGVP